MSTRTATDVAVASKNEIDKALARIAAASADHFCVDPDAAHWGDAGTLAHAAGLLQQVADILDRAGEYAGPAS